MDYQTIIKKIYELIGDSNINQFCKNVGLNQSNTNKFLKGKKYSISLEDLSKIAKYYNISIDYFLDKQLKSTELINNTDEISTSEDINDKIAERLKQFMQTRKLTAYKFNKDLGLEPSTVSRFIKREILEVKFSYLYSISKFYNIPIDYFLTDDNSKNENGIEVYSKTEINDGNYIRILSWIKTIYLSPDEREKAWFEVEFEKNFPDYLEWLDKRSKKRDTAEKRSA